MRQKSLNPAFIVLQSRLEMCWNCQQRFLSRPVFAAIYWFSSVGINTFDAERNQLQVASISGRENNAHDSMQRGVDIRQFLILFIEQRSEQAAQDGLVCDNQYIIHGLQAQ